jgi:hypothetical protein
LGSGGCGCSRCGTGGGSRGTTDQDKTDYQKSIRELEIFFSLYTSSIFSELID